MLNMMPLGVMFLGHHLLMVGGTMSGNPDVQVATQDVLVGHIGDTLACPVCKAIANRISDHTNYNKPTGIRITLRCDAGHAWTLTLYESTYQGEKVVHIIACYPQEWGASVVARDSKDGQDVFQQRLEQKLTELGCSIEHDWEGMKVTNPPGLKLDQEAMEKLMTETAEELGARPMKDEWSGFNRRIAELSQRAADSPKAKQLFEEYENDRKQMGEQFRQRWEEKLKVHGLFS